MQQSKEAGRAKKYYSLVIDDAQRLQNVMKETDIFTHNLVAPGLATIPRLSLILGALNVLILTREWGTETATAVQFSFISNLASNLLSGIYKNDTDALFDHFMEIAALVGAMLTGEREEGEPPLSRIPYVILFLNFGITTEEKFNPYMGLLSKLYKEIQYSVNTICSRMTEGYLN